MFIKNNTIQHADGFLNKTPIFQFLLLSSVFALWSAAAALNDVLITQFKSIFELSNFASALVQSAFYGAYFLVAIPASMVVKKSSYKLAILLGLALYILGCLMFFPASHAGTYTMFLAAIFCIAIGLSFLETSCNTYSAMIGEPERSTLRLNISHTINAMGYIIGLLLGKHLIFQEGVDVGHMMATLTGPELAAFKEQVLQQTLEPYKWLVGVIATIAILIAVTEYPNCKAATDSKDNQPSFGETLSYLMGNKRFFKGIVTQFAYVGMQVAVWSFTIRLALELDHNMVEHDAANYLLYAFIMYFLGKLFANYLFTKTSQENVLMGYSAVGFACLMYVTFVPNFSAVWVAVGTSALFAPCWATIFASTLQSVDTRYTETAGGFVVMSIIGGAAIPVIQGLLADNIGLQSSFIVSALCFAVVFVYFMSEKQYKQRFNFVVAKA
ncbi:L-fucose:H+ symporter permease [Photobacterium aquimaris]|uniref:L-fucose:H+ symporter permease n=1 Tax=Photobacterium aquimaris TaxID=512643 RepID=A0A2T3IPN3_9GAMM|nr:MULTISPECIES: L-fucose:H+ symporter permease [Photobacterium]OBU16964.1 L-fucose:H+ symporter permease [Photobacterium aquimaris]OBU21934.1 L-fucose:H+ symporter permease [Photobacterium aquimaris]PSU30292.1 L-fucose:H+ symporter permease [Photobacterium aquimaris]PSV99372.1 L-fucose:H+ symporter permease [Photobacterium aquimaris]